MDTREEILKTVKHNPGIGFTELREEVELANGALQHHLSRMDAVEKEKGGILPRGYCENCELKDSCGSKCLLKELRKEKTQKIIRFLSDDMKQIEMAERLDLDRSTVNYHVKKLREMGILEGTKVRVDP
ncbi:MAG: winged helix-turn-helix transcriptional regulator [Candidatus Aenigmatarchaeota archaeon]